LSLLAADTRQKQLRNRNRFKRLRILLNKRHRAFTLICRNLVPTFFISNSIVLRTENKSRSLSLICDISNSLRLGYSYSDRFITFTLLKALRLNREFTK